MFVLNVVQKLNGKMKAYPRVKTYSANYLILQNMLLIIIICLLGLILGFFIIHSNIPEGMVMNKLISQGYEECTELNECVYTPTRYIIAIQNGDNKDWLYVSKDYYDTVSIGDWIKR